jgi:hypothetical protein
MKRWTMLLLTSFALLLPASQVSARDTYIVNGYAIWLGNGPPTQSPPPGFGGWIWFGWCWGAYQIVQ